MPYSPHKIKSIFLLIYLLLIGFTNASFSAETTVFKGLYPVPFVLTNQIILKPRSDTSMSTCDIGTLFVDNTGNLIVCGKNNAKSKDLWTQSGNFVYPTDPDPSQGVSIGDNDNSSQLNIYGPKVSGQQNIITLAPIGGTDSAGMTLKVQGAGAFIPPAPPPSFWDYIDFHSDPGNVNNYDGRILYSNSVNESFSLFGGSGLVPNIYINGPSHQIGIGTTNPVERLDIFGDIETNKIKLTKDLTGTTQPTADLKVGYTNAGGGGYYAVYAP